jgi:hypothetical protein
MRGGLLLVLVTLLVSAGCFGGPSATKESKTSDPRTSIGGTTGGPEANACANATAAPGQTPLERTFQGTKGRHREQTPISYGSGAFGSTGPNHVDLPCGFIALNATLEWEDPVVPTSWQFVLEGCEGSVSGTSPLRISLNATRVQPPARCIPDVDVPPGSTVYFNANFDLRWTLTYTYVPTNETV